jgi:hypothetical protein
MPVEVQDPIPFEQDDRHATYDPVYAHRFWQILRRADVVLKAFRSRFTGKSSPVHFFWGSFDLNATRFSGRPAPLIQGAPRFVQLAEDQENFACGFWPGNVNMRGVTLGEPAFYAYIYPEPPGFQAADVRPNAAYYHADLGEFILPYEAVRQAASPDAALLAFLESTYAAAATLAAWDRAALERADENGGRG